MKATSNIRAFAPKIVGKDQTFCNFYIAPVLAGSLQDVYAKACRVTKNGRKHKSLLLVNERNETLTILRGFVAGSDIQNMHKFFA